jgi:hypothetical protein
MLEEQRTMSKNRQYDKLVRRRRLLREGLSEVHRLRNEEILLNGGGYIPPGPMRSVERLGYVYLGENQERQLTRLFPPWRGNDTTSHKFTKLFHQYETQVGLRRLADEILAVVPDYGPTSKLRTKSLLTISLNVGPHLRLIIQTIKPRFTTSEILRRLVQVLINHALSTQGETR